MFYPFRIILTIAIILGIGLKTNAQNYYSKSVLIGANGLIAEFTDTARPKVRTTMSNQLGLAFDARLTSISDSATGKPLFFCDAGTIYDTLGNKMANGDHLIDSAMYVGNWSYRQPQQSIVLPLGNKKFAVIIGNMTDSAWLNCYWNFNCLPVRGAFDELRYNLVDMNANWGNGAVVVKNKKLFTRAVLNIAQMHAVRHANGKDWWLLKPGNDSTQTMYRFLITADSVYGPMTQRWDDEHSYIYNEIGQMMFSPDGSMLASVIRNNNKLCIGNFDRCTGMLNGHRICNLPFDTIPYLNYGNDSTSTGVCIAPNNRYVYVSKGWNIFQLDLNEPDSALAWYWVKHGSDTILNGQNMAYFGTLNNGPDGRIYVGHWITSVRLGMSVIDHPNIKGPGCGWCNLCLQAPIPDSSYMVTLSNQPNYNLGPTANPDCWPVGVQGVTHLEEEFTIFPNPASHEISMVLSIPSDGKFTLSNGLGQIVFQVQLNQKLKKHTLQLPELLTGLYFYECNWRDGRHYRGKVHVWK